MNNQLDQNLRTYINQTITSFSSYKNGRWCYEDGILMNALLQLYKAKNNKDYLDFVINYYEDMITDNGMIKNYNLEEYNIDNIAPGIALFDLYNITKNEKFLKAIHYLFNQLTTHPRTNEGNFWHKKKYPYQVWLDGIYMGLVFYVKYIKMFQKDELFGDVKSQLKNVRKYLFDESKNLYLHAYDETKSMKWANTHDGKSPNVWSRSVGWLAMALVDILETNPDEEIKTMFSEMISGIDQYKFDKMWMQVVDRPEVIGNYHETSGTMMLCYAYLKGSRLGLLKNEYSQLGFDIFKTTMNRYFTEDNEGFHLGGICEVAGLDNEKRDGSIEYYLSEKIKEDEVKGVAPFILSYSEIKYLV